MAASAITLYRPSDAPISQGLGAEQKQGGIHAGTDFYYLYGGVIYDKVYAAAAGKVIWAGDARGLPWPNILYLNIDFDRTDNLDSSAGNYTIIEHYDSFGNPIALTGYGHQEAIYVNVGDWVIARQHIGKVGATGFNYGKHLHFDFVLYPYDVDDAPYYGRVDPTPYFIDSEEDDMYTDEDRARDIKAASDAAAAMRDAKNAMDYSKAARDGIIFGGDNMKYKAPLQNIVDDLPRRIAVWPITRDGKTNTWIQETADIKSINMRLEAKIDALMAVVGALSGGTVTLEQVSEIINEAVQNTLGQITATVTIGKAPESEARAIEAPKEDIVDAEIVP